MRRVKVRPLTIRGGEEDYRNFYSKRTLPALYSDEVQALI